VIDGGEYSLAVVHGGSFRVGRNCSKIVARDGVVERKTNRAGRQERQENLLFFLRALGGSLGCNLNCLPTNQKLLEGNLIFLQAILNFQ
jgi:hypothetical protein